MALQVEVKLGRVNDVPIHDGAGWTIPTPIRILRRREEPDVVTFSNNNDGDLGLYSYFIARP